MEILEKIETSTVKILEELGYEATVSSQVQEDENNIKYIKIDIEGEDLGELIGYHGNTLSSLQNVLNIMNLLDQGDEYRLIIDVNGYRTDRENNIKSIVEKAVANAKENNQEVALSPMKSFERRIVHMEIQKMDDMKSESRGEGLERHVVIIPE